MRKKFEEMTKLVTLLAKNDIPFEIRPRIDYDFGESNYGDKVQTFGVLVFHDDRSLILDAVCHPGTYGWGDGLIEIMTHGGYTHYLFGDDEDDPIAGYLTAEEAFEYCKKGWEERQRIMKNSD